MRPMRSFLPLVLVGVAAACGPVAAETAPPPDGREAPPAGVLRGTLVYSGPHPCSANGHIVGAAIIYVFDRRVLPPPNGLATSPVNLGVVTGDALFAAEPRNPGPSTYCPSQNGITDTITTNAPFAISPMAGGEYVVQSFYDYTGDYLPNFSFRSVPEQSDVGGGVIDTNDLIRPGNAENPNYQLRFLPVDIGTPDPLPDGSADQSIPNFIPNFTIPPQGFVADNLTVNVVAVIPTTRPYFYAGGMLASFDPKSGALLSQEVQSSATAPTSLKNITATKEKNANLDPILTIPQDISVFAPPTNSTVEANVNNFEAKFPRLILHPGLPSSEVPAAAAQPFHFQLPVPGATPPAGSGGFNVWQNAAFDAGKQAWEPLEIAEGGGVPLLWPLVVLKRIDTSTDPNSITTEGDATHPVILLQGITLLGGDGTGDPMKSDSVFNTATASAFGTLFDPGSGLPTVFNQDHLTVLIRPAVICFNTLFDTSNPDKRGTVVTPHLFAPTSDLPPQPGLAPIVSPASLSSAQSVALVHTLPVQACLPTGRYTINVVYPDGQAWTVPNESGVCSSAEGATNYAKLTCTIEPRPVLRSQGLRAVVEITPAANPANCAAPLPSVCLPSP
jgi:hypothetical protein